MGTYRSGVEWLRAPFEHLARDDLTAALVVCRGDEVDDDVARVWPAFAAHGKGSVTIRQALAHGAAVPGWRERLDLAEFPDREAAADVRIRLRPGPDAQAPWPLRDADGAWQQRWRTATGIMADLLHNPPELMDPVAVNGPAVRDLVAPAVSG